MLETNIKMEDHQDKAIDPVCHMTVDIATAQHKYTYHGAPYFFCAASCRSKFIANPTKYLSEADHAHPDHGSAQQASEGTVYTCPMHLEIQQIGPGTCPICGMALEPMIVTADQAPNPELLDFRRRLKIAALLALPVVILEMGGHLFDLHHWISPETNMMVQFLLTTPIVWWAGLPFLQRGWQSLFTRHYNMFTLIALGTLVAWVYSVIATFFPQLFPPLARMADGSVAVYYEAAAVIIVLVLVGQVMELRARDRTSDAIKSLLKLTPTTAFLVADDGETHEVALADVPEGAKLRVRPGDKVPVDGTILEGDASLDESLMTGESLPVAKTVNDKVIAGSLNNSGSFILRADKVGNETLLSRIVQMVASAQRSRAPIQSLADKVSGWFVPLVVACAVLAFLTWFFFGPDPKLTYALLASVAVLIIACPCALGLATPMSIMVGVGRAARSGILLRDAQALERMEKIDTLVVDKTGTLTLGKPTLQHCQTTDGYDETEVLRLAAAVEQGSSHPLALAIVTAAKDRGLEPARVMGFDQTAGKGAFGMVERKRVMIGTEHFLSDMKVDTSALESSAEKLRRSGATVVFVAINGQLAGLLAIADPLKPTTKPALRELEKLGLTIVMLTGDNRLTATSVANELGLTRIEAEVLPDAKADIIQKLQAEGHIVAMAGDGINDGPALALADVGLAMGTGTDVAMETAGITLVKGDLMGIVRSYHLSRAVMRNIRQNLIFAFIYNAAGIPIAAGVLYPIFGIVLSPILAAAAMSLSSVSVIANALRLRHIKL